MKQRLFSIIYIMCLCASCVMAQIDQLVFTRMDASDGLNDNRVVHIMQLSDGRMAVTTRGNINIYDGARFRYIHAVGGYEQKLSNYKGAYHVYEDENECLWVKDWGRVQCFNLRQGRYVAAIDSLFLALGMKDEVADLFVDSEKHLWLVTDRCVVNTSTLQTIHFSADATQLQDLEVDSGLVYMFFSNSEVRCYNKTSDEIFSSKALAADDAAECATTSLVVKSPDGNFYQLRNGHRAVCLRFNPVARKWDEILWTDYPLHTLVASDSNNVYIATKWRILHINTTTDEVNDVPMVNIEGQLEHSDNLNTIFMDNQGGIWLGTYDAGLLYAHPSRFRIKSYIGDMSPSLRVLMCGDEEVIPSGDLKETCRLTDSRGWLWCGSSDGLYVYTDTLAQPTVLYSEDGLSNCYVHSVIEDKNSDVWVATSYGLNRVNVKGITSGNKPQLSIRSFTEQDGTLSCAYQDGQAVSLPTGQLVFRGLWGYTVLHPDSIAPLRIHIHPILTGVSLNGERLTVGHPHLSETESFMRSFEFRHDENNITFDIASLNYCLPEHTRMEYRILSENDGDGEWLAASTSNGLVDSDGVMHISLINVSPGSYCLQVRASGLEYGQSLAVAFRVCPPWWQTDLARVMFLLAVIVIVVVGNIIYVRIARMRMRRRHKEEILLMRIRNLIERCDALTSECNRKSKVVEELANETVEEVVDNVAMADGADNEFIRKAVEMVEKNINTRGYTVEQLSRDLCMERTGLYKKMTALLDKSPSLFIRGIRLQRAAAMLRETTLSITEVAERTGFSSSSHMSKCFQEEWGCTPGKIRSDSVK